MVQLIVAEVEEVEEAIAEMVGAVVSTLSKTSNVCVEYPPVYVKVMYPEPLEVQIPAVQEAPVMFVPTPPSILTA